MTSKVIQGHIRQFLYQNPSSTIVYGPTFDENANIKKTKYMTTFMLWRIFVIFYFNTFWPNYITSLM